MLVFDLIFIIYFPPCDNVSLLRALKAISEFVVDRLLVQFINLFLVSLRTVLQFYFFFSFLFQSRLLNENKPHGFGMTSNEITI